MYKNKYEMKTMSIKQYTGRVVDGKDSVRGYLIVDETNTCAINRTK